MYVWRKQMNVWWANVRVCVQVGHKKWFRWCSGLYEIDWLGNPCIHRNKWEHELRNVYENYLWHILVKTVCVWPMCHCRSITVNVLYLACPIYGGLLLLLFSVYLISWLIEVFINGHLAMYLIWRRDSTAKGAKKYTAKCNTFTVCYPLKTEKEFSQFYCAYSAYRNQYIRQIENVKNVLKILRIKDNYLTSKGTHRSRNLILSISIHYIWIRSLFHSKPKHIRDALKCIYHKSQCR